MAESQRHQITQLLIDWSHGDETALDRLMPLVYQELRRMAHHHLRNERVGHTLQTTDLVNEAYLRLTDLKKVQWQERVHFFAVAARIMRRILVEQARSRQRLKRGGKHRKIALTEGTALPKVGLSDSRGRFLDLLALDEALTRLAATDPRKSKVVEMRFFGGMTNEEIAELLKIAPNTVIRDWNFAEAWLRRELGA
jgi:RNA polymerase sigma factor (TIGR02999 family)